MPKCRGCAEKKRFQVDLRNVEEFVLGMAYSMASHPEVKRALLTELQQIRKKRKVKNANRSKRT